MGTALVNLSIATGFERGYGVLKRLGATPLGRPALLGAKIVAILVVEVVQAAVLVPVALGLGWHPTAGGAGRAVVVVVLATAGFGGIGLLLAGVLRAEVNLAAANGLWLLLLLVSGMLAPLSKLPGWLQAVAKALPAAALADALHQRPRAGAGGAGVGVARARGVGRGRARRRRGHVPMGVSTPRRSDDASIGTAPACMWRWSGAAGTSPPGARRGREGGPGRRRTPAPCSCAAGWAASWRRPAAARRRKAGRTVGILPGLDRAEANPHVEVAIPTGLGEARNALVVRAADAVVAVGGEYGTLSEIALALQAGIPVVGLGTWELARAGVADDGIVRAENPDEAVARALELARNGHASHRPRCAVTTEATR